MRKTVKVLKTKQGDIPYILTRKSVKNINFRLKADGILYISASKRVPEKYIRELILKNSEGFLQAAEKLRESRETRAEKEKEGGFYFLGKRYDIETAVSDKSFCALKDKLYIYSDGTKSPEQAAAEFVLSETKRIYGEAVSKIYGMVKADGTPFPKKISIKKMTSRWGSCTPLKGNISLNSELIKYPLGCLEYVVLHEFAHFHHRGHNREFYAYVEKYMKDYKTYVKILKKPYYEAAENAENI